MTDSPGQKGFFRRQLTLTNAVLLSVLLHLVAVIGSELSLPDFYTPPDEILARKAPEHVQRVRLAAAPKPKPAASGPRFVSSHPPTPAPTPSPKKDPAPAEPTAEAAADTDVATDAGGVSGLDPEAVPDAEGASTVSPAPEPAPAFPVQIRADLELRLNSLSAIAEQHWVMEGFRYFITVNGSKFGFKAQLSSEGEIGADGGLRPGSYRMTINERIRNQADYREGALHYGKPSALRTEVMTEPPQDMASLPFHVAVTFTGSPMIVKVTSGKSLYEVRLVLDAEETIKLPVGTLRTLHLRGERYNPADGTLIAGYEVWLAPDYLNYPVKFIGRTGKGDTVEYRVRRLEIEGKNVLGDPSDHVLTPEGDDIPDWLKSRVHDTEGSDTPAGPAATPE